MGRELRIRVREDRTPPQFDELEGLEGFEVDDGEWRLSLDPHRELLVELTGVEPDGDLTLQELVTVRARLEGYVERAKRPADRANDRPGDGDRERKRTRNRDRAAANPLWRLLEWVRAVVSRGGRNRSDEAADRRPDDEIPYAADRVRALASVFRAAADARRRDVAPNAASASRSAAN